MNGLVINHSVDIISISLALFFPLGLVQWSLKETTTFDIPSENYLTHALSYKLAVLDTKLQNCK